LPKREFGRGNSKSSKEQVLGSKFLHKNNLEVELTFNQNHTGEIGNLSSQKDIIENRVKATNKLP
jgi:hypothetical protein